MCWQHIPPCWRPPSSAWPTLCATRFPSHSSWLHDPARPPTVEELLDWCDERLAKSKRPRDISFVDELPRTSVGKIRKFLLKDPAAETKHLRAKSPKEYGPT